MPIFTNFGTEDGEQSFINYIDTTLDQPDFIPTDTQEPTATTTEITPPVPLEVNVVVQEGPHPNVTVRKRRNIARPTLEVSEEDIEIAEAQPTTSKNEAGCSKQQETRPVYSNILKCPAKFVPVPKKAILETINLANSDEEFQPAKKAGKGIHICNRKMNKIILQ